MYRIAALIFGRGSPLCFSLSLCLCLCLHFSLSDIPLPTAEKCQSLHLNSTLFICIFLDIQLICLVFFFLSPPVSCFVIQQNYLLLMMMLLLVGQCRVREFCVWSGGSRGRQRRNLKRGKGVNENWIKSFWISKHLCHCTEISAALSSLGCIDIDLCSRGRREQDGDSKTVKKSLLINEGEQWQGSADLWTACHHLNIDPSVKSTHAHTVWGLYFNSTVTEISAKQHVVSVRTVKLSLSI